MSKWMIDCNGYSTEKMNWKEIKGAISSLDFRSFIEKRSSLSSEIQKTIEKAGYNITDRSGGNDKWQIGVPFDDLQEAMKYLEMMTSKYSKEIKAGSINFQLTTWSKKDW